MTPQVAGAATSAATDEEVQQPLTLVMPVAFEGVGRLRELLLRPDVQDVSSRALDKVGTVQSTRFVILEDSVNEWAKLAVIATFDGPLDAYIAAFAREMTSVFNGLLRFVEDWPPDRLVQDNVAQFVQYVIEHDIRPANGRTYRANPNLTVLDIHEATRPRQETALSVRP